MKDFGVHHTVVVVDDQPEPRQALSLLLSGEGFVVHEASNGEEALSLVRETPGPYRALITDFDMPLKNGCDLIREIEASSLSFGMYVMVTGHVETHPPIQELLATKTQRPLFVLSKPFPTRELLRILRQCFTSIIV